MVVDTSAVVAFLRNEPEAERIEETLDTAEQCRMSALNLFECRTVLWHRFGSAALGEFDLLLVRARIQIESFDEEQVTLASAAYQRFGKGTGHAAQLNLGDCAAYALAQSLDMPLLYKGNDFAQTDVIPVLH